MGIFDFITKAQAMLNAQAEALKDKANTLQDKEIQEVTKPSAPPKLSKTAKNIIAMFYADYPETPYISADRPGDWIEQASNLPHQMLVKESMMIRNADGLLPGHVYMLYWLKKYTNKKVPAYFEYKYGVDFAKEKAFLHANGYLNEMGKPTPKGEKMIAKYEDIIKSHNPPKPSATEQTEAQRQSFIKNGFTHYEFIANSNCCDICRALDGKHFKVSNMKIGVNAPPMHDGCSCAIAAWVDDAEYEAWLDSVSKGEKRK